MSTPDPEATLSGTLALASDDEWDDATLASLHEPPVTAELVAVVDYAQTDGQRRMVNWIRRAEDSEDHLWANHDKSDHLLIYESLLKLGYGRAAAAHMSPQGSLTVTPEDTCRCGSNIYAALVVEWEKRHAARAYKPGEKPAAKRRPRPSRARKTAINGGA